MNQLVFTAPELILSIGAIVLMLVAAWRGDEATPAISIAAVALLVAAAFSLLGPAGDGGVAFNGLYRADAFGSFAKVLIYATTAVCIIVAPRFFGGNGVVHERLRSEYPVLILLSTVGAGMMVSATDLLTLYIGLELQSLASYVLASFMRRDTRSAEAGLKYFVLGALASGILLYGISLVYGFTGTTGYDGIARAFGAGLTTGSCSAWCSCSPASPSRLRRSLPYVDPRRLRRRADARHHVVRDRAKGRRDRAAHPCLDGGNGFGNRRLAPDRDLCVACLDRAWRGRKPSARPT